MKNEFKFPSFNRYSQGLYFLQNFAFLNENELHGISMFCLCGLKIHLTPNMDHKLENVEKH